MAPLAITGALIASKVPVMVMLVETIRAGCWINVTGPLAVSTVRGPRGALSPAADVLLSSAGLQPDSQSVRVQQAQQGRQRTGCFIGRHIAGHNGVFSFYLTMPSRNLSCHKMNGVIIIPITICSVINERDDWRGHLQDRNSGEILHQPNRLEDDQSRAGHDSLA